LSGGLILGGWSPPGKAKECRVSRRSSRRAGRVSGVFLIYAFYFGISE